MSTLDQLSSESVSILSHILTRIRGKEEGEFFTNYYRNPASRKTTSSTSRQSRFMRITRMTNLAMAGAVLQAPKELSIRKWVLSSEFGRLHPYSMNSYSRFTYLLSQLDIPSPKECHLMWSAAEEVLLNCSMKKGDQITEDDAMCINAAIAVMFLCLILCENEIVGLWEGLFQKVKNSGYFDANPFLRMQISLMGSFVDHSEEHVRWLMEPEHLALEVADAYCFVRHDLSEQLYAVYTRCVRSEIQSASEALYPPRPASTLIHLVDYCRTCMRNPGHFHRPGTILMLLVWIDEIVREFRRLEMEGIPDSDAAGLRTALRKFERIQVMEKRKFWQVIDGMPRDDVQKRLIQLWNQKRNLTPVCQSQPL